MILAQRTSPNFNINVAYGKRNQRFKDKNKKVVKHCSNEKFL
jgi:hypothetical protein